MNCFLINEVYSAELGVLRWPSLYNIGRRASIFAACNLDFNMFVDEDGEGSQGVCVKSFEAEGGSILNGVS